MRALAFPWRRRLPRSSLLSFVLAAACATAAFLLVRAQAARLDALAPGPRTQVVVAARDLPAGARLEADDVRVEPRLQAPPAAIGAVGQALGTTLVAPIAAGEPVTTTRIDRSALAASLAPGRLLVQIQVAGIPRGLSPADRVDVFATFAGARPYTTVVGSDLRVLGTQAGASAFDGASLTTLTLEVDTTTARTLLGAAASGTLGVAVRAAA
jgi:pilus assembly protein CpaB